MMGSVVLILCLLALVQFSSGFCPRDEAERRRTSIVQLSEGYRRDPCATPKNVDIFNRNFGKAVDNCELLSSVFNEMSNVTREEFSVGAFYVAVVFKEQLGLSDAVDTTNAAAEGIVRSCDKLSPNLVKSIFSNIAGKLLNENNLLTSNNAAKYGYQYATVTKTIAKTFTGKNCPRSNVIAIGIGYLDFINRQNLLSPNVRVPSNIVFSNEWRCEDKNVSSSCKNCPIANYSPRKTFLRQSDDVCKMRSKAIDIFVSTFRNEVRRCKVLTNLFNVRSNVFPQEMSRGTYYVSLFLLGQNGAENPRQLADFMSRFIRNIKSLKTGQLEEFNARFVAKFLETGKLLDTKNAKSQAIKLANAMKKRAEQVVDNRYPLTRVVAIQLGWRYFLDLDQRLSEETAPRMAYLYGNEWRCLAKYSE